MEANDQYLSLLFYSYLCKVVGSENVVRTRRKIYNASDFAICTKETLAISTGSKAEGLDLDGSDYDIILLYKHFAVYENIDDITYKQGITDIPLLMDTNYTKPGYTRLKFDGVSPYPELFDSITCGTYFSSKLLLTFHKMMEVSVIHGPCWSNSKGNIDIVLGFHCKKWISQSDEWKNRPRSLWPHNRLVDTIVQYGVLFVPIGCKNSPRADLEFRISFNVGEKILVHSFNHVQLLCYALLKIILKDFIKPQYGELLCSYFLKTILFWILEETEESTWKPQNLLRCFDRCFKRLVYCVTFSTCLHYFIPELNFFEDRFSSFEHKALTNTLQHLYDSGWQCVLQTNLLSSFRFLIGPSPTRIVPHVSFLPRFLFAVHNISNVYNRLVFGSLKLPCKEMYAFLLSKSSQMLAQIIPNNYHRTNKEKYINYQKCLSHLLGGLHHDAVSGWLLLASFFYRFQQYQQCLYTLNYCLCKCTPDKILLFRLIDTDMHVLNLETQQHIKNRFLRICKRHGTDCVLLMTQSSIIPEELSTIFETYALPKLFFPPVVFAHFLHCICLHRLNRKSEKMNALHDLQTTLQDLHFIPFYKDLPFECFEVARKLLTE